MSRAPRAKRKITRPDIRRGSSAVTPIWRSCDREVTVTQRLASTSDRLMWWGWAVAAAFVLAGLVWHVVTFQPTPSRNTSQPTAEQVVECDTLERK